MCALLPLSRFSQEHFLLAHTSSAPSEADSLHNLWAGLVLDAGPLHPEPNFRRCLGHDGMAVALGMSGSCSHCSSFQAFLSLAGLRR